MHLDASAIDDKGGQVKHTPPKSHPEKHQPRDGEAPEFGNQDQEIWCPNVKEWMTRGDHFQRFVVSPDQLEEKK